MKKILLCATICSVFAVALFAGAPIYGSSNHAGTTIAFSGPVPGGCTC